ncbi:hypothetical protein [Ruegeria atlantica]|uniref:hypothetical protein n=1 Tax=Ruegeria atlantica TaxID=81569 RepID=UPI003D7DA5C2
MNEHIFGNLAGTRNIIGTWRTGCNKQRPQTSLGGLTSTAALVLTAAPFLPRLCSTKAPLG